MVLSILAQSIIVGRIEIMEKITLVTAIAEQMFDDTSDEDEELLCLLFKKKKRRTCIQNYMDVINRYPLSGENSEFRH